MKYHPSKKSAVVCLPISLILTLAGSILLYSCEEFVEIDPPRTELISATVFTSDATAQAAVIDMYYQLRTSGFASGDFTSISFFASLSSDEQINYFVSTPSLTAEFQQFNDNTLLANNSNVLSIWSAPYKCIHKANAIIEGLAISSGVSVNLKAQLEGEAKFIRAFCHFYLLNLFGDVPLIATTDYRINSEIPRTPSTAVYNQIIQDLIDAKGLLPDDYAFASNERVRANSGAATALLARTYLYTGDWQNAETQATEVINSTSYSLQLNLTEVFRRNNPEAILQLWSSGVPPDRTTFFVPATGPRYGALRPELVSSFEAGDTRWTTWGRSRIVGGITYYYTLKYLSFALPPLDFSTILRLAEQYLIRAEARAQMDNIIGAQEDINVIRNRAGLSDTPASDKASLLLAVEVERRHELFTEWGHRWFDLKRTGRADLILGTLKPQWATTAALYPIPEYQIINDPAMKNSQNPGY